MDNTGIIITLAYPDTVVRISDETYVSYLRYLGVGKKNYVRAGHAALVLINSEDGILEYFDFGRYTTPQGFGRVRGKETDHELDFPLIAKVEQGRVQNFDEIIKFLATNPQLTHGDGKMVVSVCHEINYQKAKAHIAQMQYTGLIKYAAFSKASSNCSRFVTDTLIASVTNQNIKKRLVKSHWFTPSTVGNVVKSNTGKAVKVVRENGLISSFKSTPARENIRCFLDRLHNYVPNTVGNIEPLIVEGVQDSAQWLAGIGAGAWFELHKTDNNNEYRFRRIAPYGHVDVNGVYKVDNSSFNYEESYNFVHYSNCSFFHIEQKQTIYKFDLLHVIS
jgi:hypothetical protein